MGDTDASKKAAQRRHITLKERFADYKGDYAFSEWDTGEAVGGEILPPYVDIYEENDILCFPEVEPDEWDIQLLADCDNDEGVSFDECLAELGLTRNDLN